MKRLFIYAIVSLLLGSVLILSAGKAMAAFDPFNDVCQGSGSGATVCQDKNTPQSTSNNSVYGPNGILTKVVRILAILIGVAAVVMIIIGGLKFVVSDGDSTKAASARNTIIYAVVGIAVAAFAQVIIVFVLDKL